MEIEKGKEKLQAPDLHLRKGGKGMSGTIKEGIEKGDYKKPGHCVAKSKIVSKLQISSERVMEDIQYMKEHALINKIFGIWPAEKTLVWWINTTWKTQGHYDLQLGAKGFFTIIFFNEEDRMKIFENGPYFYNLVGLFLRPWKEIFDPNKENLTIAPSWIRMYSLPMEYWKEEILMDIGNTLGNFIKVSEQTRQRKYILYAKICI